jgi:uncharacterized repeat protein (TIGR01451 family)
MQEGGNTMNTTLQRILPRIITYGVVWLVVFGLFFVQPARADEGNISPTDNYAWSEHTGWLNFRPADGGVTIYPDHLEGYAWAENVGWVKLGSDSGGGDPYYANTNAGNWGVNHDGMGHLSGYAWGENIGWINFNPSGSQVTINLNTGEFEGYAWGENVGWMHFSNPIPAYNVATAGADDVDLVKTQDIAVDRGSDPTTGDPFVWAGDIITYTLTATNFFDTAVSMMISDALSGFVDYVADSLQVWEDGTEVTGLDQWEWMSYDASSDEWSLAYESDPLYDSLLISFDVRVEPETPLNTLIWNTAEVSYLGGLRIDKASNTVTAEVVPEPTTFALFGIGLFALLALVQKRRKMEK